MQTFIKKHPKLVFLILICYYKVTMNKEDNFFQHEADDERSDMSSRHSTSANRGQKKSTGMFKVDRHHETSLPKKTTHDYDEFFDEPKPQSHAASSRESITRLARSDQANRTDEPSQTLHHRENRYKSPEPTREEPPKPKHDYEMDDNFLDDEDEYGTYGFLRDKATDKAPVAPQPRRRETPMAVDEDFDIEADYREKHAKNTPKRQLAGDDVMEAVRDFNFDDDEFSHKKKGFSINGLLKKIGIGVLIIIATAMVAAAAYFGMTALHKKSSPTQDTTNSAATNQTPAPATDTTQDAPKATEAPATIGVCNATGTAGLAAALLTDLSAKAADNNNWTAKLACDAGNVTGVTNAAKYVIYDFSNGKKPDAAANLQKLYGVKPLDGTTAPTGVTKTEDFVILIPQA
jgi:hypothetical protein